MLVDYLTSDPGLELIGGGEGERSPEERPLVGAQEHVGLP